MEHNVHNESVSSTGLDPSEQHQVDVIVVAQREEPRHYRRSLLRAKGLSKFWVLLGLLAYIAGLGSGYLIWKQPPGADQGQAASAHESEMQTMLAQISPQEGYRLPITLGKVGPMMLAAGVIDLKQFAKIYQEMGKPLSKGQLDILTQGSDQPVVITAENQHFLLNLFWALGLSNQNKILTDGPMMRDGKQKVVNFASTGGWTLAQKPVSEIYSASPLVQLTQDQQQRLEDVSLAVYRPCCDNPTHFPDCNHGMAMLGLLEMMAAQGATTQQMFEAAKYVNAFWFPQQTLEIALAFKVSKNLDFKQVEGSQVVGRNISSGSGFQAVHQWLAENGKLQQAPQGGGSCGVK